MENWSVLYCDAMSQKLKLKLFDYFPNISSAEFAKYSMIFEDGWYKIELFCNGYKAREVESIIVNVNGKQVGVLERESKDEQVKGSVIFQKDQDVNGKSKLTGQPFLLQYDLVVISFGITFLDGTFKELFTDFLLCVSKSQEDIDNIDHMLKELTAFDDSQIGEWLFSDVKKHSDASLHEGRWCRYAYKSLNSYVQLLKEIMICYKSNYPYFRFMGKHRIKKNFILQSYQNVKSVTVNSFQWLMQNSNQLSEISTPSGIQYQGKSYIPQKIKTEVNEKSKDVYENKVVICFLYTVLANAKQVYKEFDKDVQNEKHILEKINGNIQKGYHVPVLTIKCLQISFFQILLDKLANTIEILQMLFKQYESLFDVRIYVLASLPRKTKTFQEIKPYTQVFAAILRWFNYGEYSLEKDRLILQVKTLDKLFEYFCLIRLLKLFAENGYQKASVAQPAYKFEYSVPDGIYQNERDVANTYLLSKAGVKVTVYYQPVISAVQFQNNLELYRTTKPYQGPDYYTPDFVVKFTALDGNEEYIILDAKFSSRSSIRKYHLREVMHKYAHEVAVANPQNAPKMVWILQGRVKPDENPIWRYHNSPLANRYSQKTSFGVVSINTVTNVDQRFWHELKRNISWI